MPHHQRWSYRRLVFGGVGGRREFWVFWLEREIVKAVVVVRISGGED